VLGSGRRAGEKGQRSPCSIASTKIADGLQGDRTVLLCEGFTAQGRGELATARSTGASIAGGWTSAAPWWWTRSGLATRWVQDRDVLATRNRAATAEYTLKLRRA
jgi:hypothetical protein